MRLPFWAPMDEQMNKNGTCPGSTHPLMPGWLAVNLRVSARIFAACYHTAKLDQALRFAS